MKNGRWPIIILSILSLAAVIWAIHLNNLAQKLSGKKTELQDKLNQALRDTDFIRTQAGDLERKLEEQITENRDLLEQFNQAKNTIDQFYEEILSLTETKQELEKELGALKGEKTKEQLLESVNVPGLETSGGVNNEENTPPLENVTPSTQQ